MHARSKLEILNVNLKVVNRHVVVVVERKQQQAKKIFIAVILKNSNILVKSGTRPTANNTPSPSTTSSLLFIQLVFVRIFCCDRAIYFFCIPTNSKLK